MKRTKRIIAFICALACSTSIFVAVQSAVSRSFPTPSCFASAEEPASTELIAPPSYEEYLPLIEPTDVCASGQFTAIADKKTLYVYDKHAERYNVYEHDNTITKIQFDKQENLYFLDNENSLHLIHPVRLEIPEAFLSCSNFLIAEDTLFYTNTSGMDSSIRMLPLSNLEGTPTLLIEKVGGTPVLAYEKGELYYTRAYRLFKINPVSPTTPTPIFDFPSALTSLIVLDNMLFCCTEEGNFEVYNSNDLNVSLFTKAGSFTAISLYGKQVYALDGSSVKRYSLDEENFEDYQITSSSSAINRLNNAEAICLSDKRLFIADNGNERISVYDIGNKKFLTPIPMDISPSYIATNGNSVLVANKEQILIYNLQGTLLFSKKDLRGDILGVARVENSYYLITNSNEYLCLTPSASGEWTATTKIKSQSPSLLSSDAYGNLYVRCIDGLYEFTTTTFLSTEPSQKKVCELSKTASQIAFDYNGNLYALENGTLEKYQKNKTDGMFTKAKSFAWTDSQVCGVTPNPKAFALSISDDVAYVLDGNNYLIQRRDLALPTLKNIPVNGVDKQILTGDYSTFEIVKIKQNALLVRFDFDRLEGEEYFPYQSYKTTASEGYGIRLASSGEYDVLAVYAGNGYETYLTYSTYCEKAENTAFVTTFTEDERFTAELSSEVGLYKLPFLSSSFATEKMLRGSAVTVLGKVEGLNLDYYLVEYVTKEGERKTGYTPCAFVSAIKGEIPTQNPHKGKADADKGSVGRMIYLVLGFGIVCILTDYLILRKPKDE